ncbi:hypothetical protein BC937DRAFT_95168 [Endogone sp. FLAS-F59071]|nr:hypothetical protein BC937DRAFT_95168 [Endogone sp. FLAS-F59071]|eukprot:RUS13536.1 hypothetical protein BC937DRAFT_95168 [Endogone sp. FLAS-F59071]
MQAKVSCVGILWKGVVLLEHTQRAGRAPLILDGCFLVNTWDRAAIDWAQDIEGCGANSGFANRAQLIEDIRMTKYKRHLIRTYLTTSQLSSSHGRVPAIVKLFRNLLIGILFPSTSGLSRILFSSSALASNPSDTGESSARGMQSEEGRGPLSGDVPHVVDINDVSPEADGELWANGWIRIERDGDRFEGGSRDVESVGRVVDDWADQSRGRVVPE